MAEKRDAGHPATDPPETTALGVVFEVPDDTPTHFVEHMSVQSLPDHVVMCWYEAFLPPVVGNEAQRNAMMERLRQEGVRARCVARLVMTRKTLKDIVQVLTDNVAKWEDSDDG